MRACWVETLLVLVRPSPASCATCRGTSIAPRVLVLTHPHPHKSPCVRQPFVRISGSTAFSSLWFLSRIGRPHSGWQVAPTFSPILLRRISTNHLMAGGGL